jgi:hypothetical protein
MKNKTLVWIGVYAVVGYFAYSYFYSKKSNIQKIISSGNSTGSVSSLEGFDTGYLRKWANASKNNEPAFIYQGKIYNTKGGKAKT